MLKHWKIFFLPLIVIASFASSCRKDQITTDSSAQLDFSADTVLFDTVFTTIGSTTQLLKVYNNNDQAVSISNIQLEGGNNSMFRMNVDGVPGVNFSDVEIDAGDSMFVFIEVTVDPGNQNLPFIVEDQVLFRTNGNDQIVQLTAWGQDANFHGGLGSISLLGCDEIWNADKPHVIYGVVVVDEDCSLTINQGVQVFCHRGAGIYVGGGTLEVLGVLGNEVCFQGDRLEPEFANVPGQWGIELNFEFEDQFGVQEATVVRGGIWLSQCEGSRIDYAILKNGNIGVQVDTVKTAGTDALQITNTKIQNMSAIGLLAQGAEMSGYNNLITNCGRACGAFTIGGSYRFDHCTFANYWGEGTRQDPSFVLNNFYVDVNNNIRVRPLENTLFRNCIMWGNNAGLTDFNEFAVAIQEDEFVPPASYFFSNCAVDTDEDVEDPTFYLNILNGATPPFTSVNSNDFTLNNSTSIWQCPFVDTAPIDLAGVGRFSNIEKGCYETQ